MAVRLDYLTSGPQCSHLYSEANKEKLIKSLHSSEHSVGISPNICWYYLYYYCHHYSATTTTVANHHSCTFPVTAFTITVTISATLISSSRSRPSSLPDCPSPQPTPSSSIPSSPLPKFFVRGPDLDTAGWVWCRLDRKIKFQDSVQSENI